MMSLHCYNALANKSSIAQNAFSAVRTALMQAIIDLVAGDFNSTSWRRKVAADQQYDSTLEVAYALFRVPLGPTPLWALTACRMTGPT